MSICRYSRFTHLSNAISFSTLYGLPSVPLLPLCHRSISSLPSVAFEPPLFISLRQVRLGVFLIFTSLLFSAATSISWSIFLLILELASLWASCIHQFDLLSCSRCTFMRFTCSLQLFSLCAARLLFFLSHKPMQHS